MANIKIIMIFVFVLSVSVCISAATVAHWDMADSGAAGGAFMPGNGCRNNNDGTMVTDDFLISSTDLSGNGNHLTAWTSSWMYWSTDSYKNDFSMIYANNYPAAGTDSAYNPDIQDSGYSGVDAEAITPLAWTVEVLFSAEGVSGNQTIVGRDGYHVGGSTSSAAALYLSMRGTDLAIQYSDVAGTIHNLQVAAGLTTGTWYHAAGVCDGTTLYLYLDDTLIGSLDVSSSFDPSLGLGYGKWSIARGTWAGTAWNSGHVDRFFGAIDEVAISNEALAPGTFVIDTSTQDITIDLEDDTLTYSSLSSATVNMSRFSELHLTSSSTPLSECVINLDSNDSFLFLENIAPSVVNTSAYLNQIYVKGRVAVANSNVRLVQYLNGTVVLPHSSSFKPLTIYTGANFTGTFMSLSKDAYYKNSRLGDLEKEISSFKLKRGYAATFGQINDGSSSVPTVLGLSKTYVAQDADINIRIMPEELNDSIAFVRVFPWRWTSKKGIEAGSSDADWLACDWSYDYNNADASSTDREYIPMRHNPNWNAYSNINNNTGSTHALGFNEPDNEGDDGYCLVDDAVAAWPAMLGSGLRIVSPAPTDGGVSWLTDFVEETDAADYRVDAVAIHYYKDAWTASALESWLASIHNSTGRPVWVTEWNDGCDWTGGDPTDDYAHADRVLELAAAMDDMPFVERYAFYGACSSRQLISSGALTPAGEVYQEHTAPAAYNQMPGKNGFNCAHYEFENNTLDSLYNSNDAFVYGSQTFTNGRSGQAIELSGTNNFVTLPENLTDCQDFTFAAWVYWHGGSSWQRIFDFGRNSSAYMFLTPSTGSAMRFAIATEGPEQQITSSSVLSSNQWVHVAVTLSGDTGILYVNGSQNASNNSMTINPSDIKALSNYLGRSHFVLDAMYDGLIDDVYIANYALTSAQITGLYDGSLANVPPAFLENFTGTASVVVNTQYRDSLIYKAAGFDESGMLVFSKADGPDWLAVSSDGTISGAPTEDDLGQNAFTIRVADSAGSYSDAALNIYVEEYGVRAKYEFENDTTDSAHDYDGVATGVPAYTTGQIDQAIVLDGSDDYITLPENVAYLNTMTVMAWVYWDGVDSYERIFDFGSSTTQCMFLTPSTSSVMRFAITADGTEEVIDTTALTAGVWTHVAVTLNGSTGILYVNGTSAASNTSMTVKPSDFESIYNYIGKSQFSVDPLFAGRIDDFRIYNRVMSAAQIAAIAAGNTAPSFTTSLIENTNAVELSEYSGVSIADYAEDAQGISTLNFSLRSGPNWLTMDSDGTLSGMPVSEYAGTNTFTVRATDIEGLYAETQMSIYVDNIFSGVLGLEDLVGMASNWLSASCHDCDGADLDGDNNVTISDFDVLAHNWLISENLQLRLKLDELTGDTAADCSLYRRSGTLVNSPVWSTGYDGEGGALEFDGSNYVQVDHESSLNPGSGSYSVAFWMKSDDSSQSALMFSKRDLASPYTQYLIGLSSGNSATWPSGGKITFLFRENASNRKGGYTTSAVDFSDWTHVCVVLDANVRTVLVYIDGMSVDVTIDSDGIMPTIVTETPVYFGLNPNVSSYSYDGLIDDVRIYNKALSAEEILEISGQ